jgi:hypothetical protein
MAEIDRRRLVIGSAAVTTAAAASFGATFSVAAAEGTNDAGADAKRNPANPLGATSSKAFPNLFSPIVIGGVRLKNRVVHAAMTSYPAGTQQYVDYNANRARGGTAMIVAEEKEGGIFERDPPGTGSARRRPPPRLFAGTPGNTQRKSRTRQRPGRCER